MASSSPYDPADDKIVVELYCLNPECHPVEELVSAVANSVVWKDRVDVRVRHFEDSPYASTPYGTIANDTVVVCGTHVIHDADYSSLKRALEDCAVIGPGNNI